jgi:uncharacterized oligopeptide transporter (OPT) family protein
MAKKDKDKCDSKKLAIGTEQISDALQDIKGTLETIKKTLNDINCKNTRQENTTRKNEDSVVENRQIAIIGSTVAIIAVFFNDLLTKLKLTWFEDGLTIIIAIIFMIFSVMYAKKEAH